jgi:hypothetical protein
MPSGYGRRGYFIADHRQGGVGPDGERGTLVERDFVVCSHCDTVLYLDVYRIKGGFCLRCSLPICHGCVARGICTPRAMRQDARA